MKPDLEGDQFWRYQRVISPGLQEYIEAISFAHYLAHDSLITWKDIQDHLSDKSGTPVRFLFYVSHRTSRLGKRWLTITPFPRLVFSSADRRLFAGRVRPHGRAYALRHHRHSAQGRAGHRGRRLHVSSPVQGRVRDPHPSLKGVEEEATRYWRITTKDREWWVHRHTLTLVKGFADAACGAVTYAVAIRCFEYDLPHDVLGDIVSRTLDTSQPGESRGREGDCAEFGYD